MVRKRKIIAYFATRGDGFIGRQDGSVDWLDRPRPKGNYGMDAFYKSIDTVLWSRTTCDMAIDFQKKSVPRDSVRYKSEELFLHTWSAARGSAAGCGVREGANQSLRDPSAREKRKRHLDDGWRRHHC